MTKPSEPKKRSVSRVDRPAPLDLNTNPQPVYEYAAKAVTPNALRTLFRHLDSADETFGETQESQQAPALDALRAVVEFLNANPFNYNGRFSRPLELIYTELKPRPSRKRHRIMPPRGGGSGGITSRVSDQYVKAAAAFAVEFMHAHTDLTVKNAALGIAGVLDKLSFPFGKPRAGKAEAVEKWRRDYRRPYRQIKVDRKTESAPPRAATFFRELCANPPVTITGDATTDGNAILTWFKRLVGRAGYGAVW